MAAIGEDALGSDVLAEMNVRYPSDIVQPELAAARQEVDGQSEQERRLDRRLGLRLAQDDCGGSAGVEGFAPGEAEQDRRLSAAGRTVGKARVCQGQQELCGDQSLRVGMVGGPAIRPAAVSSRQRGGAGGPCPGHEGHAQPVGDAARLRLQGAGTVGRNGRRRRGVPRRLGHVRRAAGQRRKCGARLFRPLYREYCEILHAKDKFVFFHSDGNIGDIFGELVKVGIDAIHAQLAPHGRRSPGQAISRPGDVLGRDGLPAAA